MDPTLRSFHSDLNPENMKTIQAGSHRYSWRGVPMCKNPFDFALYWMLIWKLKPRTIIEIGSKHGGSALWLADALKLYELDGRVVSVDIEPVTTIKDPRIDFLPGDAADLGATLTDETLADLPRPWLMIEDSSHLYEHCLAAMEFFHPRLAIGDCMVIEDGNLTDMGWSDEFNGGPNRAVGEFLGRHGSEYIIITGLCDFWGSNVTWNPNGYLRKCG